MLDKRVSWQLVRLAALLTVMLTAFYYSYSYDAKYGKEVRSLVKKIKKVRGDITGTRGSEVKLNNNFSLWQEISNANVYSSYLGSGSLRTIISGICGRYKIFNEEVLISESMDVGKDYEKLHVKVAKTQVSIDFSALTDRHAFLFVHTMKHDIPGYVSIKFFEIAKERDITPELIESNVAGIQLATVRGRIIFELHNIYGGHL